VLSPFLFWSATKTGVFMTVEFKFEIGDKVTVEKLDITGVIEHASVGRSGSEYSVLSFTGNNYISRWFSEDLLKKV
jgi:Holliday junction resolvase